MLTGEISGGVGWSLVSGGCGEQGWGRSWRGAPGASTQAQQGRAQGDHRGPLGTSTSFSVCCGDSPEAAVSSAVSEAESGRG